MPRPSERSSNRAARKADLPQIELVYKLRRETLISYRISCPSDTPYFSKDIIPRERIRVTLQLGTVNAEVTTAVGDEYTRRSKNEISSVLLSWINPIKRNTRGATA